LYTLLSDRIAALADASVVVRSNLPGLGEFDCRRLADNDPLRSPLDFVLINPSARTGLTNAKSKAGDLIVEPNPILLAIAERECCYACGRQSHYQTPQGTQWLTMGRHPRAGT
jgi:hypothetical protein